MSTQTEDLEQLEQSETVDTSSDMRFTTKKFVVQALLEKASNVLPSKDILPVLKNFRIEARDGQLRVAATDLELSVVATAKLVDVEREGSAVFNGQRLLAIAKESEDSEMVVDVSGGTAEIGVGRARWTLQLMDASEYPELPDIAEVDFVEVDRSKFIGGVESVRHAAATDTVRPSLMMIDVKNGSMRTSDGVRFQQVDLGDDLPLDMQIPIAAVENLVKLLRSTESKTIEIGDTEDHLVFRLQGDVFIANKLVAVFPNVDEVLLRPALTNNQKLFVDREELTRAVRRVRIAADPETAAVVLELSADTLVVKARDKYGNMAEHPLDVVWEGQDREVSFNADQFLDMLDMAEAKSCEFRLGEDKKTRPSPILLVDEVAHMRGVLNQMRVDFIS